MFIVAEIEMFKIKDLILEKNLLVVLFHDRSARRKVGWKKNKKKKSKIRNREGEKEEINREKREKK